MLMIRISLAAATVALALVATTSAAGPFVDVLAIPATMSPLASRTLMQAVTRVGDRLVAVGQRGTIVVSADAGKTWTQSPVPVSSDLTGVFFVDGKRGWAVGHDGVVLGTADGGDRWQLLLDGRRANEILVRAMERRVAVEPASESAKAMLAEAKRYLEQGPDKPFLDVWFADASNGYIVGAYNLIFRTTDGGATWEPWFDRTDNPKFFNLYSIRPAAGRLWIAGEGGVVLTLDPAAQRFVAVPTPYNGSYFGVTGARNAIVVFGLRGNVYRSEDGGNSWTKVDSGLSGAVVAAASTSAGATLLADAGGRVASTEDGGQTFRRLELTLSVPLTAIAAAASGALVLAGPRGVAITEVAPR